MLSYLPAVLVVEDEDLIRFAIADELEEQGFVVFLANGADEAIASIENHPEIAVVFTDIDMPGSMDGIRLAAFVRNRWPPIKIIVTSGRVDPRGLLADDIPFLAKPYDHAKVVGTIRGLMSI
ncbi:response regulator [Rhizobium sp. SIMBA_035]